VRGDDTVVCGMVAYELIKIIAEMKKRQWTCHCIEGSQLPRASATLLHEFLMEGNETFMNLKY
jgi:hypothetical protein